MNPIRILAAATAIELCGCSFFLAVLGLGGAFNGWLDLINVAAPLFLALALAGLWMTRVWLGRGRLRTLCVGLALAAAGFDLFLMAPDLFHPTAAAAKPGKVYRIVTINVARENNSPFTAAKDIAGRGADAVLIQDAEGTIQRAGAVLRRDYAYSTACPETGVQIWLKTPILDQGCGLQLSRNEDQENWGRAFVWLRTLGPDGRPITLACAHIGRPYQPGRQAAERQALDAALAKLPKNEMILAGDFNTPPWTFAMRRQDRMFTPLRRLTRFWWSWPARINLLHGIWSLPFLPIDHVYVGAQWRSAQPLLRVRVAGSDHFGTEAGLQIAR